MDAVDWGLRVLHDYLRLPSISAHGKAVRESVDFLTSLFREAGFQVSSPDAGGPPAVLARSRPGRLSILFYNHYDVQPPDPLEEWKSDPFVPTVRDGMLFARGVADNKANLIVRLAAWRALAESGREPPVEARFFVEGEEEIGSKHLPALLEAHPDFVKADLTIWESSYRDERGRPQVVCGCKGIIHGELVARGANTDLHSSRGVIVPNPAVRLAHALAAIRSVEDDVLIEGFHDAVTVPSPADRDAIRDIPFEEESLRKNLGLTAFVKNATGEALKERYFFAPVFNVCGLRAGYTGEGHKTVLPREAVLKFDIRIVPDQTPEDILGKLRRHLDKRGFGDVELRDAYGYPAARTPVDHPMVEKVRRTGEEAWGQRPVAHPLMPMSGPMYLFARHAPVVGIGVGHAKSNIHAPNESIYLDDFRVGIDHVRRLLLAMGEP